MQNRASALLCISGYRSSKSRQNTARCSSVSPPLRAANAHPQAASCASVEVRASGSFQAREVETRATVLLGRQTRCT